VAADDPSTEILPAPADETIQSPAPKARVAGGVHAIDAETNLVGRTLGRFSIVEKLGRGGSGDVYRAEQQQLGRSAVIKVLRRGTSLNPTKIDRFLREAKLASRLDHPYAAHVYAFGAEPDGELWIAMEYVRGATLDELVNRRGPIPPAIFGPLFGRVCEVVHTAHELGIVHRDIKGSNVMVIERAGQLLPKLLDFGIAKADLPEGDDDSPATTIDEILEDKELTQMGATLGSPHYMSPEQWLRPADVDARADIYALGVLAYRCCSGAVPFKYADRATLIDAHLRAPPPALPERVPEPLATAIYRALEKDPDGRWPTALAFGEAVQRAAGASAPEAVPSFDPYTRDVWLRAGPQPIADACARLAESATAIDCEVAIRELVGITCRWLAVLALATQRGTGADAEIRERARDVVGRDDAHPWLELARALARAGARSQDTVARGVPGLTAALAGSDALAALAERIDGRFGARGARDDNRARDPRPAPSLALDIAAAADALRPIEPLLAYQLVVGRGAQWAESWVGTRRRDRDRVLVWGDPLADGDVALLDAAGKVVARLSPFAQVIAPMPSADPEMFLLWRGGRGSARLVAAPWGFELDDDRAAARLATLTTEDGETAHDDAGDASPYPGLAAYREGDAERFVGREREVEALANRLVRAPLLAVLGPSGAGKSSFIHAGVMPRLEQNGYRVVSMRPGRHPMHALAALPTVSADSLDGGATAARLRELGESAQRGLVIVIDQLEELVTLCGDADERTRFAEALAAATADGARSPVRVVVTLRDDFAAVIESEQALRGMFEVFVLGTPLPESLRRIVVEPARRAGVVVEPAVVDDMVAEVAGRPASLPLLSFTASQLWATRDKQAHSITHAAYLALGGVAGALSTYADQVYDSLARKDQQVVRELFARLVALDGTRIPAPRAELEQLPDARAVLAHLIDARLLVARQDESTRSRDSARTVDAVDYIEIVHECLAERWDRLAQWRREDAADSALLADVRAAARRWLDTGRSAGLLWRGEPLVELRKLVARAPALTDDERAFADASDAADRRARRVRRGAIAGAMAALAVVATLTTYLGVDASTSRDAAEQSAAEARATAKLADDRLTSSIVEQGTTHLNSGRELEALAYFGEALRRGADSIGLREMIAIASRGWRAHVGSMQSVLAMAPLPNGAGFVTGNRDSKLRWLGPDGTPTGREVDLGLGPITDLQDQVDRITVVADSGVALLAPTCCDVLLKVTRPGFVHDLAPGPGSDEITTMEKDGLHVIGRDGTVRRSLAFSGQFTDAAYDREGQHALVWSGGTLTAVDLATFAQHPLARDMHGDLAQSHDRETFAYIDDARVIHVLHADGSAIATIHPTIYAAGVVLSPTGDRVAALTEHAIAVYDRDGNELQRFTSELSAQGAAMVEGDDVWTASRDGKLRHYQRGVLVASLPVHVADIIDVQLGGRLIATLGSDYELQLTRADAMQFRPSDPPCPRVSSWPFDQAVLSVCKDGRFLMYIGTHQVGAIVGITDDTPTVAWDPTTKMAAVASDALSVYGPDATMRGLSRKMKAFDIAFQDAQHLLVLEQVDPKLTASAGATAGVWRWEFATDRWERLFDAPHGLGLTSTPYGIYVSFDDGHVGRFVDGHEVARVEVGGRVAYFVQTRDHEHMAMQVSSGATLFADTRTGTIGRRLPAADSSDTSPSFDDTGELLVRPTNGIMQIWDRTTGEALVYNLDLLHVPSGVTFGADGTLELQGDRTGVLDIARDPRPAAAIEADIACKVPLAIVDGRLEPAARRCP
jgi:tRNA A-37 threonylcarbamoyl transferase component Bud32